MYSCIIYTWLIDYGNVINSIKVLKCIIKY